MTTLPLSRLPRHIAIIMDGNGRWAKKRLLPRTAGHKVGVESVKRIVNYCGELKIEALTLFAFSSENWRRPTEEVSVLMQLFMWLLEHEIENLHKNQVCVRVIGDRTAFMPQLQTLIEKAEHKTKENSGLKLVIAANYGGQWDIAQAARQVAAQVEAGQLRSEEITAEVFGRYVCSADLPPPDLFIRTGNEQRISNFLLWQLAYTELYFTDILWPDFDRATLDKALQEFAQRQRRFGQTSEQVEKNV